jgi:hypothetical protein
MRRALQTAAAIHQCRRKRGQVLLKLQPRRDCLTDPDKSVSVKAMSVNAEDLNDK